MPKNNTVKVEKFRLLGESILDDQKPANMEDFLKGKDPNRDSEIHIPTNTPLCKSTSQKLGRLHLQIRKELIDRIFHEVFRRKRDLDVSSRNATQRAVIEEALERYFAGKDENKDGLK